MTSLLTSLLALDPCSGPANKYIHVRSCMLANANDDEGLNQEVVKVSERSKAAEFMSLYMFLITDKLDGLVSGGKRKREGDHMSGLVDFLQLPDDYATRMSEPGKKRVDPGLCSALRL